MRKGRLPAEVTDFVGRRQEVAEIRRLLRTARLVTLTGVGGTGKTRLALHVAAQLRRAFDDGVWHVDLSPLTEGLFEYTVAEALGLGAQTGRPLLDAIIDYLRDRDLLLLLDNAEHLVDACAAFVDTALCAADGLRVLCTSRQALGVAGEHVVTVLPLPLPDPDSVLALENAAGYPALELFAARAAAAASGFTLTTDNQAAVLDICRRLDGLPLAIELAAAQLRTLSVGQLAESLHQRPGLLAARHAIPPRHRTMQATFDWSFERCTPEEQSLWTQVSVFADTFTLEAAQRVCTDDGLTADGMLAVIAGLVDKSVLIRMELTEGDPGGTVRYRLLDTVRQYGLEKLTALRDAATDAPLAPTTAPHRRHRDWYLAVAERFDAEWFGPEQRRWSNYLRLEQANLRAALSFCLAAPGKTRAALRLVGALTYYWYACGLHDEGLYWLDRALAADPEPTMLRARALSAYFMIVTTQGNRVTSAAAAQKCWELATLLDDPSLVARAVVHRGMDMMLTGEDLKEAQDLLEEGLARLAELGASDVQVVIAQLSLAATALHLGNATRAAELCATCQETCRARGDRWWLAYAEITAALIAQAQGDPAGAVTHALESLRLRVELHDPLGMAGSFERLAWIASANGQCERAATLFGAAQQIWRRIGQTLYGAPAWLQGHEEHEARVRAALGDDRFDALSQAGAELPFDDAVAYALGTRHPVPAQPTPALEPAAPVRLTRREQQVAELVADGLSNREVADRLVVSQRTAESHVENVLRKLDFTSRTQIATWIVRQRGSG